MVPHIISISLFLSVFTELSTGREMSDCFAGNPNPYLKFSTKTAYEFIHQDPKIGDFGVPNCEPVQLWVLARHGTRYPGQKTIRAMSNLEQLKTEILRNHEERRNGRLCYADLDSLKEWKFTVKQTDASLLTKQGRADLYYMGKRMRTKHHTLFQKGYQPYWFEFRHTDSKRTKESAQEFARGLFEPNYDVLIPPAIENDPILKPYDNCTYWSKQVKENPDNQREAELFKLSEDMVTLVHNVSLRLGFLYDLSIDTINTMYDMCRYDKAWNFKERSPWCAAFIKDELMTLEYLNDIKAYYDSGYGDELNLRLGCTPIKDMLDRFERLEDGNAQNGQEPLGVFYFTHSSMLLMTLARLGIANHGFPLRHDNYHEQRDRDWRTSDLSPFAGNLEAVFFKCNVGEYNRVMFYLNEKKIDYEGCDVGLCSWEYIRNKLSGITQNCNLDWCRSSGNNINYLHSLFLFFGFQILIFIHPNHFCGIAYTNKT